MIVTHRLVLIATLQSMRDQIRRNLTELAMDPEDTDEREEHLAQLAVVQGLDALIAEQQRQIRVRVREHSIGQPDVAFLAGELAAQGVYSCAEADARNWYLTHDPETRAAVDALLSTKKESI